MSGPLHFPARSSRHSTVLERVDSYTALQESVRRVEQGIAEADTLPEAELFVVWAQAMKGLMDRIVVQATAKVQALTKPHTHPCQHCLIELPCRGEDTPCLEGFSMNYLCARCEDERDQAREEESRLHE